MASASRKTARGRGRRDARKPAKPASGGVERLFGLNSVEAALRAERRRLSALHVKAGGKPGGTSERIAVLQGHAAERGVPVHTHPAAELEALARSPSHQGAVLDCGPLPTLDESTALAWGDPDPAAGLPAPPLLVALDQVADPRNLGAIVRACAAFGAMGVVVPRDHSAPLSPVASSASAGTLETFPVHLCANLARFLEQAKRRGFWVVGTDAERGAPLAAYRHDRPLVLVLGSEGRGLRPLVASACDEHLRIPLPGRDAAPSLNVASAAAVALYELLGR